MPRLTTPQCYLGKVRLEKAIDLYKKTYPGGKEDTFTISWSPFYLDPTSPKVGVPLRERMLQRFGPQFEMMQKRLHAAGKLDGINFSSGSKVGNTRDSHRLVELAKAKGNDVENRVISELFRSYFENDGDITSHDMLVAAAEKAGLDAAEVRAWLAGDQGGKEVDAQVARANAKNVHGVPQFTIQDKLVVDGAQDPDAFVRAFVALKEGKAGDSGSSGYQC